MKTLLNNKAFTLLETILSIAIITAVSLPLLTIFLQSVKTDQAAKNVLNANYISQDYIEKLDSTDYIEALSNKPNRNPIGEYYLSAKIIPSGIAHNALCDYVHVIFREDNSMLAVMPDGQWNIYQSVNSISLTISGNKYSFTVDSNTIIGDMQHSRCILQVNTMKKTTSSNISLSAGTNCKALLHCKKHQKSEFTISGDADIFEGLIDGETSLVNVTAYVYDNPTSVKAIAVTESCINIRNWLN